MFQNLNNATSVDMSADNRGFVFKKALGTYYVRQGDRVVTCAVSNKLRKQLVYPIADPNSVRRRVMQVKDIDSVDPVAIGDQVTFVDAGDGTGMITDVLPRRSKLSRPSVDGNRRTRPGTQPIEQVMVANLDQIVIVMPAAQPSPSWELLDRYLVTAEAAGLPALICLTKTDLLNGDSLSNELETYRKIGYSVIVTSAVTNEGIEAIKTALRDRISVLWGKSGVGKTSLLNAIQPGLGLRVNEVNRFNSEGRHTTTHLEMFDLDFGGSVVDTPGQRKFKLWDVDLDDLAQLLPEMRSYLGQCRFGVDCSHVREPGCAIKAAVAGGQISARRYNSYLEMKDYFRE